MLIYHRLNIYLKPSPLTPHKFIGSTLRGAFGMSLKKVTCINSSYICERCFAKDNCLYYDFYEQKNCAHRFRFDFELNPKTYDFSLYLFEEATNKLPYIVTAIYKMLTEQGLSDKRERFEIDKIICNDREIYKDDAFDLSGVNPKIFKENSSFSNIKLTFSTPLRMKYQGKLLNKKTPLEILLYSITNRLNEFKNIPKTKLAFTPQYKEQSASIRFEDQTRLSTRQKTKLQIGGIVGYIIYDAIDEKSYQLLKLGEIIGVGKQTVFGLGKIVVEDL